MYSPSCGQKLVSYGGYKQSQANKKAHWSRDVHVFVDSKMHYMLLHTRVHTCEHTYMYIYFQLAIRLIVCCISQLIFFDWLWAMHVHVAAISTTPVVAGSAHFYGSIW